MAQRYPGVWVQEPNAARRLWALPTGVRAVPSVRVVLAAIALL